MKRIASQIAGMAGLSTVLGLTFNASNPIGIRWSSSPQSSAPVAAVGQVSQTPQAPGQLSHSVIPTADPTLTSPLAPPTVQNFPEVSWPETKQLLAGGKIVLVDVRGKPTYDAGHIPSAVSLQEWSTPEEILAFQKKYGTNTPLVLYCGNITCPASEELASKLVKDYGYKNVSVMKGGYAEWQKAELGYDPTPTRTTWAETKALMASGVVVLVDARPKAIYEAGHIPGALSLPEASPEDEFKAFQKTYHPEQHIVVYCSDLKCAASMRVAVKLVTWYNFRKVQFMPGGFQEWQQSELAQVKPGS